MEEPPAVKPSIQQTDRWNLPASIAVIVLFSALFWASLFGLFRLFLP